MTTLLPITDEADTQPQTADLEHDVPPGQSRPGPRRRRVAKQRDDAGPRLPVWRRSRRRWRPSFLAGAPTAGFTGANGMGKTLVAASVIANDDLRRGRDVYSTVQIDSPWGSSKPLISMRQLLDLRDATVFLDEVAAIFSSRDSLAVPREFDLFLQTMRHKGITVRWTAPAWARADVRLRECTQVVVGCHGLGKYRPKVLDPETGDRVPQFWPRPLAIGVGALDTTEIGVDDTPEKVLKRRIFIPQLLVGWGAYDSLADTPRIGHPPTGGACVDCGGIMPRIACSVERHQELGMPGGIVTSPRGRSRGPAG